MTDSEFTEAMKGYAQDPCADCGEELGKCWMERYSETKDRLEKVHLDCGGGR